MGILNANEFILFNRLLASGIILRYRVKDSTGKVHRVSAAEYSLLNKYIQSGRLPFKKILTLALTTFLALAVSNQHVIGSTELLAPTETVNHYYTPLIAATEKDTFSHNIASNTKNQFWLQVEFKL